MSKKDNNEKKNNNFLRDLKSELKKVTWPTFKKLVNNTGAVISIVIILAAIVFVLDLCFENLNKFGVEKLKTIVSSESESEIDTSDTEETDEESEVNNENENSLQEIPEETTDETITEGEEIPQAEDTVETENSNPEENT